MSRRPDPSPHRVRGFSMPHEMYLELLALADEHERTVSGEARIAFRAHIEACRKDAEQ